MFDLKLTPAELSDLIKEMDENTFARFLYCQHMSSTFMAVHKLEHTIIIAMLTCDRIKTCKSPAGDVADAGQLLLNKLDELQSSTLGN